MQAQRCAHNAEVRKDACDRMRLSLTISVVVTIVGRAWSLGVIMMERRIWNTDAGMVIPRLGGRGLGSRVPPCVVARGYEWSAGERSSDRRRHPTVHLTFRGSGTTMMQGCVMESSNANRGTWYLGLLPGSGMAVAEGCV